MKIDKGFDEAVEGLEKAEGDKAIVGHLSATVHTHCTVANEGQMSDWVRNIKF